VAAAAGGNQIFTFFWACWATAAGLAAAGCCGEFSALREDVSRGCLMMRGEMLFGCGFTEFWRADLRAAAAVALPCRL
jgi:hypothetical protein